MDKENKRVLIVSDVPIYTIKNGIGIRVLEETLKGFMNRSYTIDLFYPSYDPDSSFNNKKGFERINDYSWYVPNYFRLIKTPYLSYITRSLSWIYFLIKFKKDFFSHLKSNEYNVHYGIGNLGSFLIHRNFLSDDAVKVSRLLGTASLHKRYNHPLKRLLVYPYLMAYKVKSDLYVITDDGTSGHLLMGKVNKYNPPYLYLRNGIDKEIFGKKSSIESLKKKYNISDDVKVLLTVNRLSKEKRVDRLIKMMKDLEDDNTVLFVVGDGEMRPILEAMVYRFGVHDKVVFTGALPHLKISDYLILCDVFLSVNDTSNASNPVFEAMTAGCCIVAINNGTTASIFGQDSASLIEPDSVNKLSEIVAELLKDDAKRGELKKNAKKHAEETILSWEERISLELNHIETYMKGKKKNWLN